MNSLETLFNNINLTWGTCLFDIALGDLTPRQLQQYQCDCSTKERDITLYLWTYNIGYAYEAYWAMLLDATKEELISYKVTKDEIPNNFKPDTKLKDIYKSNSTWDLH